MKGIKVRGPSYAGAMAELIFACVLLAGCNNFFMFGVSHDPPAVGSLTSGGSSTYAVTYNANAGSGNVPTDSNNYLQKAAVTVLGSGSLVRTGYTFTAWNTQANGGGTVYAAGVTFPMGTANVILYALWTSSNLTITSSGTIVTITGYTTAPSGLLTIPRGVTNVGDNAFRHCTALTSLSFPSSVTSIGDDAFRHCTALTSVSFPSSVTSIGDNAFHHCSALTSVVVQATTPPALPSGSGAFSNCAAGLRIHVPSSALVATYKAATGWSDYASIIVSP